ncbi:anti-sigma factor antagonist [Actinophytocola oryzae]|uniref:Anti-sigma factor antagonist n=1 Tax=Actinophytocola oryzae TaxID=502181 RepID=A0A4R7VW35_9PSEU|nr:anti-sigma factor antagonist [Actinophytocola oryzae]TDV53689.1 anti-anti-sigma factor [Actinophytocola oryzae]
MADALRRRPLLDVGVRPVGDGVALVTVSGEVDIATVPSLRAVLLPQAADHAVRLLVCDLSRVTFFGCSGVTALLDANAALTARGARLRLVAQTHAVLRPLAVTGMLSVLPVSSDVRGTLF